MFNDRISDYFEGVAAKYLSAVDASNTRENHQHEIGGLPSAGFRQYLGEPGKNEKLSFQARMVYLTDEDDAPEICTDTVTWYDCRWKKPNRRAEYRLYYKANAITDRFSEGDFFLIGKMRDNSLLLVFAPAGSSVEAQLRTLFGIDAVDASFKKGLLDGVNLLLPLRYLLEEIGIDVGGERDDDHWLDCLLTAFGAEGLPQTALFSRFARESLSKEVDVMAEPDAALMAWMDHEEKLFRIYERYLVQRRLQEGFGVDGRDVDAFISFSLSVQNRRKSRAGHAFEGHLDTLFRLHGLRFEQGRGSGRVTENNAKPDFLFPDFASYRDANFPEQSLLMLGAKTTCKDRWRQVLSEASRIPVKHLVTLEAAISEAQTREMQSHQLQLVVPEPIHATYSSTQKSWLYSVADFIREVRNRQA